MPRIGLRPLLMAFGLAAVAAAPANAESVLRVVPQSDIAVFDPYATQATISRIFGLTVYDQLFAYDQAMHPRPQMVGTEKISPDKLTYDLTLRDGLKFSNGQPVTGADVIASLNRGLKGQDPLVQLMLKRMTGFEAVDARTVRLRFAKPFAYVEAALAQTDAVVMRAEDIAAAGDKPMTTTIGSGPFIFDHSAFTPGALVSFDRNPGYIPRAEPADGLAGGKRALVDKVQWVIIPDLQTRIAALKKGEVDLLDQLPHDGIQQLRASPDIIVEDGSKLGNDVFLRTNTLTPPFNDVRARQAMALLVNQTDYLSAAFTTDSRWWHPCYSFFGCGVPNSSEAGSQAYQKPNIARAKQLFAEAGYKGEKIIVLSTQEIPLIDALAEVTVSELKSAGINAEIAMSDWGSLVVRRSKPTGWNIFDSGVDVATLAQPATNILIDARCDRDNYVGWPCSKALEAMRTGMIDDPDPAKLKAYSEALWNEFPSIMLGQYQQPIAYRKVLSGVLHGQVLAFWNIAKK